MPTVGGAGRAEPSRAGCCLSPRAGRLSARPPGYGVASVRGARTRWRGRAPRCVGSWRGERVTWLHNRCFRCIALQCAPPAWGSGDRGLGSSVERRELDRTQIMKVLVIGLGGVTNGGKTTLAKRLRKQLPNCSILAQDDFFKPESEVEIDEHGFKQYDVLDALYMEEMVTSIRSWMKNPTGSSVSTAESKSTPVNLKSTEEVHILIAEGFLLYNYEPLNEVWDRRYFLTVPYEECKRRRSTRVYQPADRPGYFDGHVWPMYLKHKREMEENTNNIVYLDGTKSEEDLFSYVYNDIVRELEAWKK